MTERRQKLRGTSAQLDAELGLEGLLAYDTERKDLRVYDGVLLGGYRIPNLASIDTWLPERLQPDSKLLAGVSADTATEAGFYRTDATTTTLPAADVGTLLVEGTVGTILTQTWTRDDNSARHRRTKIGVAAWSAWELQVDFTYLTTNAAAIAYDANRLDGQDGTYYTNIVARLGYTPLNKAGDTMTGALRFHAFSGTNGFENGTGNGASYSIFNYALRSEYGLGMLDNVGAVRGYYDARLGKWDTLGGFFKNGVEAVYRDGGTYAINISGNAATTTLATKASTLSQNGGNGAAMTFEYNAEAGQPTYLWGTNNGTLFRVYNPSNFSVATAANAGTLNGIDSSGFVQNSEIGTKYAALDYNVIGTIAMCSKFSGADLTQGGLTSGDRLKYSNADASYVSAAIDGATTWMCIGRVTAGTGAASVSLFKRIS